MGSVVRFYSESIEVGSIFNARFMLDIKLYFLKLQSTGAWSNG